jgi:predicted hydrocarbon binding protein
MNKSTSEGEGGRGFFIMYGEAIKTLQDELVSVLGIALARSFLFRFGYKCGFVTAREMGLQGHGTQAIEHLGEIWMEIGLARPVSIEQKKNGLVLKVTETLESAHDGNGCDFTRGFLGGLMASITNVPHYSIESQCVSKGADACVFEVSEES